MARVSPVKVSGSSRVRFIMLDADLANGDLTQITQAIQNALRPPALPQQRLVVATPPAGTASAMANGAGEPSATIESESDTVEENSTPEELSEAAPQSTKPRKFRTPKVLEIDLHTEPSFKSFAEQKSPPSDLKRFLVAAAWFKLHRKTDAITADHAYTCYRSIKWPTAIADFAQPLRELKRRQLVDAAGKGQFAINHLGLAEVGE